MNWMDGTNMSWMLDYREKKGEGWIYPIVCWMDGRMQREKRKGWIDKGCESKGRKLLSNTSNPIDKIRKEK